MASTNKTANYELSQFLGTDKPAWLTDYNTDMSKIDAGINTAQSTATGADGKANTANTSIGTLANLTTDVKTDLVSAINEVDGHADTAQNTANSANTTANSVQNQLNSFQNEFTFTTTVYNATTPNNRSISGNASLNAGSDSNLYIAKSPNTVMFKCYGRQNITVNQSGNTTITLPIANFPVTTSYDIAGAGSAVRGDGNNINEVQPVSLTVSNNQIQIKIPTNRTGIWYVWIAPCLFFNADFGDLPEEE